jgi:hypothetical protein
VRGSAKYLPKTGSTASTLNLTAERRRYSLTLHRTADVAMIILGVMVESLLGLIPGRGPVLFIVCIVFGIFANIQRRKIATLLEAEQP